MSKKNIYASRKTIASTRGNVYYYWRYLKENRLFVFSFPALPKSQSPGFSAQLMYCADMVEMDSIQCAMGDLDDEAPMPPRDPMLQLISLQRASGFWLLESALAAVFGRTLKDVESATPASVCCGLVWFGTSNICLIDLIGFVFHHQRKNEK